MNCPYCNAELPENTGFCTSCGAPMNDAAKAKASGAPPTSSPAPRQPAAVGTYRARPGSHKTATDGVVGVVFLAAGIVIALLGIYFFFLYDLIPAFTASLPGANEPGVYTLLRLVHSVGNLLAYALWILAGVFLIVGGILAMTKGTGASQARSACALIAGAVVLNIAAFVAYVYLNNLGFSVNLFLGGLWKELIAVVIAIGLFVCVQIKKRAKQSKKREAREDML